MLDRVLADRQVSNIHNAADMFLEDKLPYGDKHKPSIRWLRDLVEEDQLSKVCKDINRHNLLYLAAARSCLRYIHQLRNKCLSTLLKDTGGDGGWDSVADRWGGDGPSVPGEGWEE
jgi:hypothetical protein